MRDARYVALSVRSVSTCRYQLHSRTPADGVVLARLHIPGVTRAPSETGQTRHAGGDELSSWIANPSRFPLPGWGGSSAVVVRYHVPRGVRPAPVLEHEGDRRSQG